MCEFWSAQCELCGCCCSAQRVMCESCPAHQAPVFHSLVVASAHLVNETVCVPDSRHGMYLGSRKSRVSISSRNCFEIFPICGSLGPEFFEKRTKIGRCSGWGYFFLVFCRVVLLGWCCFSPPLFLEGAALLLLLLVVLFLLRGVAWPPSVEGVAFFPSLFAWCCLPYPPPLGGAAFSPLLLGGAFSQSSVGRCCFASSFFGRCSGWGYFSLVLCRVVLLGGVAFLPLFFGGCCPSSPPSGGAVSVASCCLASFCGKCCVFPFSFCVVLFCPLLLRVVFWVGPLFPCLLLGGAARHHHFFFKKKEKKRKTEKKASKRTCAENGV